MLSILLSFLMGVMADQSPGSNELAPYVVVLGVAQDAGHPQAGCELPCCAAAWRDPARRHLVSCIAIVDPVSRERWIVDATPDLREQIRRLDEIAPRAEGAQPLDGVLLTHAHIGHYTGLMFLGHESMGARSIPTYAMPRMQEFLATNGPWDQLVRFRNIRLVELSADTSVALNDRIRVTPILVPHRDEYSETVAFRIEGPERVVLFVPDIDKWDRWDRALEDVLADVDTAYVDGTFYADGELPGRDMSAIPHPFIAETMERLAPLEDGERRKVRFIHLNHTNPALDPASDASTAIEDAGFGVAREGERVGL